MGDRDTAATHRHALSVLSLILGSLVLVSLAVALAAGAIGFRPASTGPTEAGLVGLVLLAAAVAGGLLVAAGIGLRRRAAWARTTGFAACALALFNVPVGTTDGLSGLWVLARPGAEAALDEARPTG